MPQIAQQDYILISPPLENLHPLDWVEGIVRIMRAVLGNTGMGLVLRHEDASNYLVGQAL